MILDILNMLALIEWIALGIVVLDALQSEEPEVYEDDAETLL